jgi:hypothetical protein
MHLIKVETMFSKNLTNPLYKYSASFTSKVLATNLSKEIEIYFARKNKHF